MDWLGKSYYNFGAIDCWSYGSGALFLVERQVAVAQHMLVKSQKAVYTISSYLMPQLPLSRSATSSPLGFWELFFSQFLDSGWVAQCGRRKSISSYCGSAKLGRLDKLVYGESDVWSVRCETVFRSHKSWTLISKYTVQKLNFGFELRKLRIGNLRSFRFSWWSFTASFSTS